MKVLITGGAGYIGSTVASACLDSGITPIVLDDLSTGPVEFADGRDFYRGDVADGAVVDTIFRDHPDLTAVIHCAARTVVADSVADPLGYYRANVSKTVDLLAHLRRNDCQRIVFSSSAAVYAAVGLSWVDETSALAPQSPYGRTKQIVEQVLEDASGTGLRALSLRYFNPIGADPQLRSGSYSAAPSHVLGRMLTAKRSEVPFEVAGMGWPTRDGSAIRDYIHIWDVARAHVAALRAFDGLLPPSGGHRVFNIGTGQGTTVLELAQAVDRVIGPLDVVVGARRPGDVVGAIARVDRALAWLGWQAELSIDEAVLSAWRWSQIWAGRTVSTR